MGHDQPGPGARLCGHLHILCKIMRNIVDSSILDDHAGCGVQVPDSLVDFMFENTFKEQILTLEQLRDRDTSRPY